MRIWSRGRKGASGPSGPTGAQAVQEELNRAQRRDVRTDSHLRAALGYGSVIAAALQLVSANIAFYIYAIHEHWKLPPEVMIGWLGATVAQIVGIVLVIAKYLFPDGGGGTSGNTGASRS